MFNISIEDKMRSDYEGFQSLISMYDSITHLSDPHINLDFSSNHWFEANLCAVIGGIKEQLTERGKTITVQGFNKELDNVLHRNTFLMDFGEGKIEDTMNTVIPYHKFTPYQDVEFIEYIQNRLISKPDFPKLSNLLGKKISQSIFEVFENARIHGHCKYIFTCGQYYPNRRKKRLDMTIVDMGVTIKSKVNQYLKQNLSGAETINWAMQYGNTTKTGNVPGGLGLGLILEFLTLNQGMIQVVSSDGYWEMRKGAVLSKLFEKSFPGTIVNIEFNLDDDNSYVLAEEVSSDSIF